jgi:hypothetical protein
VEPLKLACGLVSEWKERSRREAPAAARYLDAPQRCERFADGEPSRTPCGPSTSVRDPLWGLRLWRDRVASAGPLSDVRWSKMTSRRRGVISEMRHPIVGAGSTGDAA